MKFIYLLFLFFSTFEVFAAQFTDTRSEEASAHSEILTDIAVQNADDQNQTEIVPKLDWEKTYLIKTGNAVELYNLAEQMYKRFPRQHPNINGFCYPWSKTKSIEEYRCAYQRITKRVDSSATADSNSTTRTVDSDYYYEAESFGEHYYAKNDVVLGYHNGPQFALSYDSIGPDQASLFLTLDPNTPNHVRKFIMPFIEKVIIEALSPSSIRG
ncbi:MAG TPA: hypothetical protein VEL47_07960 [Myxococcota bacterium]|nr:hypothetical protein [Myxococcota bacterium]